ncbi:SH3 domain-containing protein [Tenacibaculum geojense]|uniref:SH3 domain-containing protein n=1 Tax=Tenacibaculum geojense TaxID=915352 RepID=A0ABW3JRF0_9FLAO
MIFRYITTFCLFLIISGCKQEKKQDNLGQAETKKVDFVEKIEPKKNKKLSNDNLIGLINDPDGYTNIRSNPNSKSDVVGKIFKGSYFHYNEDVNNNWYPVTTQTGLKGYVHKSRIERVDSKPLIFLKINSEDPTDFSFDRDTIVKIETLNENSPYFLREYNYPKIKEITKNENSILFEDKNVKVQINRKEVTIGDYKISEENNFVKIVPEGGYKVFGAIGKPKYELSRIQGDINNRPFSIKKQKLKYLFEPNLTSAKVYKKSDDEIIIYLRGSGASEGYEVIFIIDGKTLIKRHIYRGF